MKIFQAEATVYYGASIPGGETVIGKGCTIGDHAFITQSVAAGTRVSIKNWSLILERQNKY